MYSIKKPWEYGKLKVTENKRYLTNGEKPFFWMGDTAWLLLDNLSLEETYVYLKNRKEKGFNIILLDLIHYLDQTNKKGSTALIDNNFAKPNLDHDFWDHADQVIAMAEDLGMYMGILPVWASSILDCGHFDGESAKKYVSFVVDRYKECPHIIWVNGGDIKGDRDLELFGELGKIFKKITPDNLVTFHPFGRNTSSTWFHHEEWLDFNMFQSGHRRYDQASLGTWDDNPISGEYFGEDSWKYVEKDYDLAPLKPTIDGEPSYENVPQGLHDPSQPSWQACDVRRYAYWSVFAGAMGHIYGHGSIMQFYNDVAAKGAYGLNVQWQDALHHDGSSHMTHLASLMNKINFTIGSQAEDLLVGPQKEKYDRIATFASGEYILCYLYNHQEFELNLSSYKDKKLEMYWFDPVTGTYSYIDQVSGLEKLKIKTPEKPALDHDWVLYIKVNA